MSNGPVYHYDINQNTPEWDNIRLGKMTGSVSGLFLVNGKRKISVSEGFSASIGVGFQTFIYRKAGEWITGEAQQVGGFSGNQITEWGHAYEPEAVERYNELNWEDAKKVGFVQRSHWAGCSPDRLIGDDGGLEVKCFQQTNFLKVRDGVYEKMKDIERQIQWCLYVTRRKWWDFFCYHPHPSFGEHNYVQKRYRPDAEMFEKFRLAELAFIAEINRITKDYFE